MKTLELFCGTKSFSKVAKEFGYETKTLDNEDQFNADFLWISWILMYLC